MILASKNLQVRKIWLKIGKLKDNYEEKFVLHQLHQAESVS